MPTIVCQRVAIEDEGEYCDLMYSNRLLGMLRLQVQQLGHYDTAGAVVYGAVHTDYALFQKP